MKILYISYCAPYDCAFHAGAQTLNYYMKRLSSMEQFDVDVVTYCGPEEVSKIKKESSGVEYHLVVRPKGMRRLLGRITSLNSKYNPFHRSCNLMTRYSTKLLLDKLVELSAANYKPDVVFLEWTQIVLIIDDVKKIFPEAKYIASEADVTFLSRERKYKNENKYVLKAYKKLQYYNCKKWEMKALNMADYIFTQNTKDVKLILHDGTIKINKVGVQTPYYHKSQLTYSRETNDILFFGAMSREENVSAVIWFIKNVMPLIEDLPCRFVVLGGGLSESVKQLQTDKIIMKGFVESIDEDFSKGMCFVCPLVLGAGIKVKVIEALYSDIPVITNQIGIEGINAVNGENYIHCEKPDEYASAIRQIYSQRDYHIHGRLVIEKEFSLDDSFKRYVDTIQTLGV